MPNNDHLKSARQMIDDLINDNPEASKQSFHDFLKAKTIAKLNPELATDDESEDMDMDADADGDTNVDTEGQDEDQDGDTNVDTEDEAVDTEDDSEE